MKKFDLNSIDRDLFSLKEGEFCGQRAYLVGPKDKKILHNIKWDHENKYFRSCVLSDEGVLLSAGFPKFMNYGEAADTFPPPKSLSDDMTIVEKIDGSCMIVDFHNRKLNARTRGTLDASVLKNGEEFYELLNQNSKLRYFLESHKEVSLIFEIVTPKNRIVVKYDNLDFYLIGAINKKNYKLFPQDLVDQIALEIEVQRPNKFSFRRLEELLPVVKEWQGKEGVCLYSGPDTIHKIKSDWWLRANAILKGFGGKKKIIDYYLAHGEPTPEKAIELLAKDHDYELVLLVKDRFEELFQIRQTIRARISQIKQVLKKYDGLSRKDLAAKILNNKNIKEAGLYFAVLDNSVPERWFRRQYLENMKGKDLDLEGQLLRVKTRSL